MKKLIYLLVAGTFTIFTACSSGDTSTEEATPTEVVACANDCAKACCLGCKATEGDAKCLADHSCCAATDEASEGDHDHGDHDHGDHDHGDHDH